MLGSNTKTSFLTDTIFHVYSRILMSMTTNENGILPCIVTITSLMERSIRCFYEFYLVVDNKTNSNFNKFKLLEKKYTRLYIHLIEPPVILKSISKLVKNLERWPISAYYRLFLPDLLPNINRIIYVDYDCIILDDLDEMYGLNITNYNLKAIIDPNPGWNKHIFFNKKYVCTGVLLMNLKRMRKTNMTGKYLQFLLNNASIINIADQTVINNVNWEFNGFLPMKYGILFCGIGPKQYYNGIQYKIFPLDEIVEAMEHPIIAHIVSKPFKGFNNYKVSILWWCFAMMTDFWDEYKIKYNHLFVLYSKILNISINNGTNKIA